VVDGFADGDVELCSYLWAQSNEYLVLFFADPDGKVVIELWHVHCTMCHPKGNDLQAKMM
jgi:hypothetical protein